MCMYAYQTVPVGNSSPVSRLTPTIPVDSSSQQWPMLPEHRAGLAADIPGKISRT